MCDTYNICTTSRPRRVYGFVWLYICTCINCGACNEERIAAERWQRQSIYKTCMFNVVRTLQQFERGGGEEVCVWVALIEIPLLSHYVVVQMCAHTIMQYIRVMLQMSKRVGWRLRQQRVQRVRLFNLWFDQRNVFQSQSKFVKWPEHHPTANAFLNTFTVRRPRFQIV